MSASITPGTYRARGIDGSQEISESSTGNTQIAIKLAIDVHGAREEAWTYLSFSEKAMQFSLRRLRALGFTGADPFALAGLDRNEVEVEVKLKEHEGKERTVIDIKIPRETKPLDSDAKRRFREQFKSIAAPTATTEDPPEPTEAAFGGDDGHDEIPF